MHNTHVYNTKLCKYYISNIIQIFVFDTVSCGLCSFTLVSSFPNKKSKLINKLRRKI